MKSHRKELWFEIKTRRDYINITEKVQAEIDASGVHEGLCLVNAMHITASVYINDDEPGLIKDYDDFLERLGKQGRYPFTLLPHDLSSSVFRWGDSEERDLIFFPTWQ